MKVKDQPRKRYITEAQITTLLSGKTIEGRSVQIGPRRAARMRRRLEELRGG